MNRLLSTTLLASSLPLISMAQERPNIIVFLVDDMGLMDTSLPFVTDINCEPQRYPLNDWYRTPAMEELATRGVQFSRFYAQNVSSPSRTSIITGQNSTRHHTTNWINSENNNRNENGPLEWNWEGLTKSDVTLPRILQESGYRTIHVGKAHFGPFGSEGEDPCNVGYDVNIAGSSIGQPGSYYGEHGYGHIKGFKPRAVDGLEKYHGTDTFLTEALTLEAISEIDKAMEMDKPFYLSLAHYALHAPFESDPRYINNYKVSEDKSDKAVAYATLVEGMDKSLGDLVKHLEDKGVADNTFIVFVGDNGGDAPLGAELEHFSSAPLRGKKGSVYEGGVRVPFIASWVEVNESNPNQKKFPIKQGEIITERASIMDIFPTIAKLADVKSPKGHIVDGAQLWKMFNGQKDSKHDSSILLNFPHSHRGSYFSSYIEGDWKVIYRYLPEGDELKYELYNLTEDPFENNNLSEKDPEMLKNMISTMIKKLEKENAQYPVDSNKNTIYPEVPKI